jgi:hypothetical protein
VAAVIVRGGVKGLSSMLGSMRRVAGEPAEAWSGAVGAGPSRCGRTRLGQGVGPDDADTGRGGEACSDNERLGAQPAVVGAVPSDSTVAAPPGLCAAPAGASGA